MCDMMNVDEYLKARTGEGAQFWMEWIGTTIQEHTDDKRSTDCDCWLSLLSATLWRKVKNLKCYDWTKQDENIVCSSLVGLILVLWATRIIRAKSFDPRRPLEVRKAMMKRGWEYKDLLTDAMSDPSMDKKFFPQQEWVCPFTGDKV